MQANTDMFLISIDTQHSAGQHRYVPYIYGYTTQCRPTQRCSLYLWVHNTVQANTYVPYIYGYTTQCRPTQRCSLYIWVHNTVQANTYVPYIYGYTTQCRPTEMFLIFMGTQHSAGQHRDVPNNESPLYVKNTLAHFFANHVIMF